MGRSVDVGGRDVSKLAGERMISNGVSRCLVGRDMMWSECGWPDSKQVGGVGTAISCGGRVLWT